MSSHGDQRTYKGCVLGAFVSFVFCTEHALHAEWARLDAGNLTKGTRSLSPFGTIDPFVEEPAKVFQPLMRAALQSKVEWAESAVVAEVCADSEASCYGGPSGSIRWLVINDEVYLCLAKHFPDLGLHFWVRMHCCLNGLACDTVLETKHSEHASSI